ncbi:hypothetical protein PO068_28050 [Bacteroides thetaiotaomicron]|nr:hypothetical protein [Bacteroides thetaiotaomicron]MDC2217739.1 hypothetical protein [Bacteroides thetaiotaomicron]
MFGKAGEVLKKAVEQYRPDAVVCVGQAGGRAAITPEMIAVNIMDARIPDNAGNKPCHELIIKREFDEFKTKQAVCQMYVVH